MSRLIQFYRNKCTTDSGHYLSDILKWDAKQWEACHDFIQWAFPLTEPSAYNPNAPLLSEDEINVFKLSKDIQMTITSIVERAKRFLGFYSKEKPHWFKSRDHNMLRVTRILRFLNLVGRSEDMMEIYSWLINQDIKFPNIVSEETISYWVDAVDGVNFCLISIKNE